MTQVTEDIHIESLKPLDLIQLVKATLGLTYVAYPQHCAIHGTPTRGNRITGYVLPCCDWHEWLLDSLPGLEHWEAKQGRPGFRNDQRPNQTPRR